MRNLRLIVACLAAGALFARALVPAGWMPNTGVERHSLFMPCPMTGGTMQMRAPSHDPAKRNPASAHDGPFCPFAATAHYAPPSPAPVLQRPLRVAAAARVSHGRMPALSFSIDWGRAARAPPSGT